MLVTLLSEASSSLAGAAADVLTEVVLKRMDAAAKLRYSLYMMALLARKRLISSRLVDARPAEEPVRAEST